MPIGHGRNTDSPDGSAGTTDLNPTQCIRQEEGVNPFLAGMHGKVDRLTSLLITSKAVNGKRKPLARIVSIY